MSSSDLNNKVALITGGNGLLGQEHCEALLEKGSVVYSGDITKITVKKI